jgi:hypothetical protein
MLGIIAIFSVYVNGYSTPHNVDIPLKYMNITPVNSVESYLTIEGEGENIKFVMKKTNDLKSINVNDSVVFVKEKDCNGYAMFMNDKKICFDHVTEKMDLCKDKEKDFMLWDVQNSDGGGFKICTSQKYNYWLLNYCYEYCITITNDKSADDDLIVKAEYVRGGYVNQLFDIYEKKNDKKLENLETAK